LVRRKACIDPYVNRYGTGIFDSRYKINRHDGYKNLAAASPLIFMVFAKALKLRESLSESKLNFTGRFCFILFRLSIVFNRSFSRISHHGLNENETRANLATTRLRHTNNQTPS